MDSKGFVALKLKLISDGKILFLKYLQQKFSADKAT